jgi:hypothetical protein
MTDQDPIEHDYESRIAEAQKMLDEGSPWASNYINMAKEIRALRRLCERAAWVVLDSKLRKDLFYASQGEPVE